MRTLLATILLFSVTSLQAQLFRPSISQYDTSARWAPVSSAVIGAGAGAIIGHQSKHSKEGALIGAGVGLVGGWLYQDRAIQRQNNRILMPQQPRRNTGKIVGTSLGALAGGIIGHQSGERTNGALIGAGVGLLGGAMYDRNTSTRYQNNIRATNSISSRYSMRDGRSNAELYRIYGDHASQLVR